MSAGGGKWWDDANVRRDPPQPPEHSEWPPTQSEAAPSAPVSAVPPRAAGSRPRRAPRVPRKVLTLLLVAGIVLGGVIVAVVALRSSSGASNTAAYIVDRGVEESFAECIVDKIKSEIGGFSDFDDGVGRGQGTGTVDGFIQVFYSRCKAQTALSEDEMLDKFPSGF